MDPFEIPTDISQVEDLAAAIQAARDAFQAERDSGDVERLTALTQFVETAQAEQTARDERSAQLASLDDRMTASDTDPAPEPAPEPTPEPASADPAPRADAAPAPEPAEPSEPAEPAEPSQTASARRAAPSPSQVAAHATSAAPPARREGEPRLGGGRLFAAMTAQGVGAGQEIGFSDIGRLAATHIRTLSHAPQGQQTVQLATLRRDFPAELIADENTEDLSQQMAVAAERGRQNAVDVSEQLAAASDMSRLPGGTLQPRTFDASTQTFQGGWCAPSETLYDRFCPGPSMDGMWTVPEINARRGGLKWPESIDFCTIFNDPGFVIYTEQDLIDGVVKPCLEVPCPGFKECRLSAVPLCILGGLLMQNAYPEWVAKYVSDLLAVHAHWMNAQRLHRVEEASTQVTIPGSEASYGAAAPLLGAVELAISDLKDAYRLSDDALLEVVLPHWIRGVLRSDLARRMGVDLLDVGDDRIREWFRRRHAVVQWVYDWQSLGNDQSPGESPAEDCPPVPVTAWPEQVRFLVYPAGTWTVATTDVIDLNTFYDSTLLENNQYGIRFTETGFCILDNCPGGRVYTVPICADGRTGAADGTACQV